MAPALEASGDAPPVLPTPVISLHAKSADIGLDFALNIPVKVPESRSLQGMVSILATALSKNMAVDMTQAAQVQKFNAAFQMGVQLRDEQYAFFKRIREQSDRTTRIIQNMKRDYYREIDHLREQISRLKGNPAADVEESVFFFDPDAYRIPEWNDIVEQLDAERMKREVLREEQGPVVKRVPVHMLCNKCRGKFLDGNEDICCTRETQTEPQLVGLAEMAVQTGTSVDGDDTGDEDMDTEFAEGHPSKAQKRKRRASKAGALDLMRNNELKAHCKKLAARMLERQAESYKKHLLRMSFARLRGDDEDSRVDAPHISDNATSGTAAAGVAVGSLRDRRGSESVLAGRGRANGVTTAASPAKVASGHQRTRTAASIESTPERGGKVSAGVGGKPPRSVDRRDVSDDREEAVSATRGGSEMVREGDHASASERKAEGIRRLVQTLQRRQDSAKAAEHALAGLEINAKGGEKGIKAAATRMLVRSLAAYERHLKRHALARLFGIETDEEMPPVPPQSRGPMDAFAADQSAPSTQQPARSGVLRRSNSGGALDVSAQALQSGRHRADVDEASTNEVAAGMKRNQSPHLASSKSVSHPSLLAPPGWKDQAGNVIDSRKSSKSSRVMSAPGFQCNLSKEMQQAASQLAAPSRSDVDSWPTSLRDSPAREWPPPASRSTLQVGAGFSSDAHRRAPSGSRRRQHSCPSDAMHIARVNVGLESLGEVAPASRNRTQVTTLPTIIKSPNVIKRPTSGRPRMHGSAADLPTGCV
eukprot:TRINITY_DN15040_c0_g1_i1.p1 TRINITY_DN15040_c0_g1~~TRINITY_DN15040_c0_g1_i1.p1  ORF type:complete len:784 (-),score=140.38 TRINITY_DN15040_c0_g1_i1:50-2338(-)